MRGAVVLDGRSQVFGWTAAVATVVIASSEWKKIWRSCTAGIWRCVALLSNLKMRLVMIAECGVRIAE
jgi:hypothetical protein